MKLAIFVEGQTEGCLREFLGRWLEQKQIQGLGVRLRPFKGVGEYLAEIQRSANLALSTPDVVGAVGIMDFYASTLKYPDGSVAAQYEWAKQEVERRVDHPRFRQHFAVHETEAWLLSDPQIFPREIRTGLPKTSRPESVNHRRPPGHRLKDIYWRKLNKKYKKPIEGASLFRKLNPETAYHRCPHLRLLLDDILTLATRSL